MGYNIRFENGNYLCHKSHKYIDKKWSHGRWNYIYEEAKDKLGIGTADKVSNARDEARRTNYEARKANEVLATATANRQYWAKRLDPSGKTGNSKYNYAYVSEKNAKANADRANASNDRAHARLGAAEYTHENSLAYKAEQAAKTVSDSIKKGKELVTTKINNLLFGMIVSTAMLRVGRNK